LIRDVAQYHKKGINLLGLTTKNIFVGEDGKLIYCDWMLAKLKDDSN
jgi:tRNA A-37 threonylcarbamoyl transferase component Bud32